MSASMDLTASKKNLAEALGDSMKIYLQLLKSWFKQKVSREDFDHEARKLLSMDSVHLHNQFLLAIMSKCQSLGSTLISRDSSSSSHSLAPSPAKVSRKTKVAKKKPQNVRSNFQQIFVPQNPLAHLPNAELPNPEEKGPGFANREMLLPDIGMVHGRFVVAAWETGVEEVDDNAVRIIMLAVEAHLKNVLTVAVGQRSAYRLREKRFRYGMGTSLPQPTLRNTSMVEQYMDDSEATTLSSKGIHMPSVKTSVETATRDASIHLACAGDMVPTTQPLTLMDMLHALRVHKSAIPSHTVYATNMERIINKLWHASHEELNQDVIHRQEMHIKRYITAAQQTAQKTW